MGRTGTGEVKVRPARRNENGMTDRGVAFGVLLVWAVVGVTSPAAGDAKLGAWLVQEGRSYALTSQARATEADARIVLALMQAAREAAPQLVEAYRWQFEMASLGLHGLLACGRHPSAAMDRSPGLREADGGRAPGLAGVDCGGEHGGTFPGGQ